MPASKEALGDADPRRGERLPLSPTAHVIPLLKYTPHTNTLWLVTLSLLWVKRERPAK